MFVFMTIDAEVFPIRSILRIVAVVSIPVMDGQEMAVLLFKLSPAFRAYEPVYPEGLVTIRTGGTSRLLQFSHNIQRGFLVPCRRTEFLSQPTVFPVISHVNTPWSFAQISSTLL